MKFVGVERAARETSDTQVDPGTQALGLTIPGLEIASAELIWQPRQNGWLSMGPKPSAAVWAVVKNAVPSSIACRSSRVAEG